MADRAFQAEHRRCLAEYSICRKRLKRRGQNCSLDEGKRQWGVNFYKCAPPARTPFGASSGATRENLTDDGGRASAVPPEFNLSPSKSCNCHAASID